MLNQNIRANLAFWLLVATSALLSYRDLPRDAFTASIGAIVVWALAPSRSTHGKEGA